MKTTELNGTEYKLTEGEGGKITLTPLKKQPEKRTPKSGDVWEDKEFGEAYLIGDEESICLDGRDNPGGVDPFNFIGDTYLGKHHEVYVNRAEFISDVREALSHKDFHGDSILNSTGCSVTVTGLEKSRKALRKLNIITD